MKYRIREVTGWFIISPSGIAENNEPLRVRHLFHRWLAREGVKVIVDLKEIDQLGVWEVGLLTSFKREVDQRAGVLRVCRLNPNLSGYFQNDRFAGLFDIYADIGSAMAGMESD